MSTKYIEAVLERCKDQDVGEDFAELVEALAELKALREAAAVVTSRGPVEFHENERAWAVLRAIAKEGA